MTTIRRKKQSERNGKQKFKKFTKDFKYFILKFQMLQKGCTIYWPKFYIKNNNDKDYCPKKTGNNETFLLMKLESQIPFGNKILF